MDKVNLLRDTLKQHLPWHGARLNFLALFLMALIRVRTVNLTSFSLAFRKSAQPESNYKRLQRFFSKFDYDLSQIAKIIVNLMNIPQPIVFVVIVFLSVVFTVNFPLKVSAFAQLPFLPSPQSLDFDLPETPPWDLNRAEPCGRFLCSNVFFFADLDFTRDRIRVAIARDISKPSRELALEVEQRAKFIQNIFRGGFNNAQTFIQNNPLPETKDLKFWLITTQKPLHPATPIVEIGIENNQTVIFFVRSEDLGLVQQAIITVTEVDAKANFTTVDQLAEIWREKIRYSFSNALWGLEMDQQQPFLRLYISLSLMSIALLLIFLTRKIQKLLKKWKKQLYQTLEEIYEELRVNPESKSTKIKENKNTKLTENSKENIHGYPQLIDKILSKSISQGKNLLHEGLSFSAKFLPLSPHQKNSFIKERIHLIELISNLLFLSQVTVIYLMVSAISITFRETRFLFNLFFTQAILLPLIWIIMVLADKIIDFWIDNALNEWAKEQQEINPHSNRPILRVNTYSPALRGATTVIFAIIGVFLTLGIIGLSPTIIASAGIVAVAFAVVSRNLFDDILNGILILLTDRYAIGDVIEINGLMGCVESLNLYTTAFRNLDGQLITIPNGQISSVINMTKNWSQVNFTIEVAWNADIQKTMTILQTVADQMYQEEVWAEDMMSSAQILGIEKIAHDGITIRLIIKTQPSQQWRIAREYRWRVKQAFDIAGISLGIPQTVIWQQKN